MWNDVLMLTKLLHFLGFRHVAPKVPALVHSTACGRGMRSWSGLGLTAVLLVGLAGCGGGDDGVSAEQTTALDRERAAAIAETMAYRGTAALRERVANITSSPSLTVRARGDVVDDIGPIMQLRVDGVVVGMVEVTNAGWADFTFSAPQLQAGSSVDVVVNNYQNISGKNRLLHVLYVSDGRTTMLSNTPAVVTDRGKDGQAFDGLDLIPGQTTIWGNGALRMTWPANNAVAADLVLRRQDASRFLMQTTFGATPASIEQLTQQTYANWIRDQQALPVVDRYVPAVQARYDLGDAYRPNGSLYAPHEVVREFWRSSLNAPDQLRRRVAYALHQIFMVSQVDSNLWQHSRAYASYLDLLNRNAFGNYRTLLQDMALSPAMGIYLTHMRNRPEDPSLGRVPDENFAREILQLFSIGLYELNADGSLKLDAAGNPIDTYGNEDVMALARVFTGWSWGFPDNELTPVNFYWFGPNYKQANDTQIDLQAMKAYPGLHSTGAKTLFAGKPWTVSMPANASAQDDLRMALDAIFQHPNVGPFISRQLIQKLVTSQPSPAYVARISAVFADNGEGVRGDLGAVVRAILLDTEARGPTSADFGKLREPTLRIMQWARAFNATFTTNTHDLSWQIKPTGQRVYQAPSVFGDFRPGYIPPNSSFAERGATAPEFQLANENTVAGWINLAQDMASGGLGWANGQQEFLVNYSAFEQRLMTSDVAGMLDDIDHLLFGSTMSNELRQHIVQAIGFVPGYDAFSQMYRARMAVFIAMASPEYLIQR
jgi:uncharacterized protein (DUF1800 family)